MLLCLSVLSYNTKAPRADSHAAPLTQQKNDTGMEGKRHVFKPLSARV